MSLSVMEHEKDKRAIISASNYPKFVRFMIAELRAEEAAFENGEANEYQRGRIRALKDILRKFPNTGI